MKRSSIVWKAGDLAVSGPGGAAGCAMGAKVPNAQLLAPALLGKSPVTVTREAVETYLRRAARGPGGGMIAAIARELPYMGIADRRRFWARVDKDGPVPENRPELGPCWLWKGKRGAPRRFHYKGGTYRAARIAYSLAKGTIGIGQVPDHLCLRKGCVNPDHLEAVTPGENVLRWVIAARRKAAGACHDLSQGF